MLEDREPSRGSPVIDVGQLKTVIEKETCKIPRELPKELQVSQKTACNHLNAIVKSKKLNKWVPHDLNETQIMHKCEICSCLILRNQTGPFLYLRNERANKKAINKDENVINCKRN
ncbi:histone-lysine N-methyltransferase SETMAR-like [Octopus sinensis]|uniref:Histone-lysine N-methyltransferase SETMAR-like n=1 Tax=Octopus sinensis TaxID=2607531 RepID=A0A7E6F1E0_9MOLL|nr:histone-lysine N-methyltransferase SETMAR-like [Octopus sinensis]